MRRHMHTHTPSLIKHRRNQTNISSMLISVRIKKHTLRLCAGHERRDWYWDLTHVKIRTPILKRVHSGSCVWGLADVNSGFNAALSPRCCLRSDASFISTALSNLTVCWRREQQSVYARWVTRCWEVSKYVFLCVCVCVVMEWTNTGQCNTIQNKFSSINLSRSCLL